MRKLLWKEWHEQSWKLGFGCIVLSALAVIGLHARITSDETMSMWVCVFGLALLPVLASSGLLPAERSEGSFESLLALPVSPWKILAAKTLMGLVLCEGPMMVAAVASVAAAGGREMSDFAILDLYARSTLATVSLFIWMLALTSRLPNEARAALLAMGVLIFWMLATMGMVDGDIPALVFAPSPMAVVFRVPETIRPGPSFKIALGVQGIISVLLWMWTCKHLSGHVEERT
jgi:ABC-type transport system involved in multi-copper enzyme maturation permease subunit